MKKLGNKLTLNRETLRTLTGIELAEAEGGGTSTTLTSNTVATCESCVCPSRRVAC